MNMRNAQAVVRIGGASGFWGDSSVGPQQLVATGNVDYLVFDYLAELTMSILAASRVKDPDLGYATDFVTVAMKSVLRQAVEKGIRIISNAGGVNPHACAKALATLATELGVNVEIAVVTGDDVATLVSQRRAQGKPMREMFSGEAMPVDILTANAYLGALPVKAALDAGADIVITGRCVDSAVTLGALMHEFDWDSADLDRLAGGSLAGHILECGCQATGGLHTDWNTVPRWADIGYPIAECHGDGSFICTKPLGTGGRVSVAVIAEQMLYEVGDPARYVLPDVVCDFTDVTLRQVGEDRVEVRGARGKPPTNYYKVCATYREGFKVSAQMTIVGFDAVAKAERTAEAIFGRTSALLEGAGFAPYARTNVEVLGAESCYGPHASRAAQAREVVLRLAATHECKGALELLAREIAPAGTSWAVGTTGFGGGRPSVSPSIRQFSFLLPKVDLMATVSLSNASFPVRQPTVPELDDQIGHAAEVEQDLAVGLLLGSDDWIQVPLIQLAWARSGDKGDTSNIGVIARDPRVLPILRAQMTTAAVAAHLAHLVQGKVTRFEVPGIHAFNFVCEQALDGGGMASLRNDSLGKGMGQILLTMPIRVSQALLELVRSHASSMSSRLFA